jgi:hypothetical protein
MSLLKSHSSTWNSSDTWFKSWTRYHDRNFRGYNRFLPQRTAASHTFYDLNRCTTSFCPISSCVLKLIRFLYYLIERWKPLWSSAQSSWLQIQRSGFDSRRYRIFWQVVGLERSPLSLVSTIEELLERHSSGSGLETEITAVGIRHNDRTTQSNRKTWQEHRQEEVARLVWFARGLRPRSYMLLLIYTGWARLN